MDICHFRLNQTQIRSLLKRALHERAIGGAIGLYALGMHRRALSEVQNPALKHDPIGRAAHFTAKRVDLIDQMPLAGASDRRIAGHIPHRVQIDCKQDCGKSQTCAGKRTFYSRVTGADDTYIDAAREIFLTVHVKVL